MLKKTNRLNSEVMETLEAAVPNSDTPGSDLTSLRCWLSKGFRRSLVYYISCLSFRERTVHWLIFAIEKLQFFHLFIALFVSPGLNIA